MTDRTSPLTYNQLLQQSHTELAGIKTRFAAAAAACDALKTRTEEYLALEASLGTPVPAPGGGALAPARSIGSPMSASFFLRSPAESAAESLAESVVQLPAVQPPSSPSPSRLVTTLSSQGRIQLDALTSAMAASGVTVNAQIVNALAASIAGHDSLKQSWARLRDECDQQRAAVTDLFQDLISTIERLVRACPAVLARKIDTWASLQRHCRTLQDSLWLLRKRYTTDLAAEPWKTAWQTHPLLNAAAAAETEPHDMALRIELVKDVSAWLIQRTQQLRELPGEPDSVPYGARTLPSGAPVSRTVARYDQHGMTLPDAKKPSVNGRTAFQTRLMRDNIRNVLKWAYPDGSVRMDVRPWSVTGRRMPLTRDILVEYVGRLCEGEMEGQLLVEELCRLVPVLEAVLLSKDREQQQQEPTASSPPAWVAAAGSEEVNGLLVDAVAFAQWAEHARRFLYADVSVFQPALLDLVLRYGRIANEIAEAKPAVDGLDLSLLAYRLQNLHLQQNGYWDSPARL